MTTARQIPNISRQIRMLEREENSLLVSAHAIHARVGGYSMEEGRKLRDALKLREKILELCTEEENAYQKVKYEALRDELRACKAAVETAQLAAKAARGGENKSAEVSLDRAFSSAALSQNEASPAKAQPAGSSKEEEDSKYEALIYSFFQEKPEVTLDDYIGREELLEQIKKVFSSGDRKVQDYLELLANNCICLYGPPGCGKTYLFDCIAGSKMKENPNYKYISVSASALISKYSGETEKYIAALFRVAEKNAPCLVVLDEGERLLVKKDGEHVSGHEKRMVSEFQLACDRILKSDKDITFVCCTNYPDQCEAAMLSRFKTIELPFPSEEERCRAFERQLRMLQLDDSISFEEMAARTSEYSYRDIGKIADSMKYSIWGKAEHYPNGERVIRAFQKGEICLAREIFEKAMKENCPIDLAQRRAKVAEKAENKAE